MLLLLCLSSAHRLLAKSKNVHEANFKTQSTAGVSARANGYLPLSSPVINWPLVHSVNPPSPKDNWDSMKDQSYFSIEGVRSRCDVQVEESADQGTDSEGFSL